MSPPITSRATVADIASLAGVSKSTVSLAFNSPDRVARDTLNRILSVADELSYHPNPLARGLSTGRNNLVGVVIKDLTNPHFGAVLEAVQHAAMQAGYVVVSLTGGTGDLQFLRTLEQLNVRAAILAPIESDDNLDAALATSPIQFLTYGQKHRTLPCDHVGLDNRRATAILVDHLVALGHRRIGHVAGNQGISTGAERLDGVRSSLASHDLSLRSEDIGYGNYDESRSFEVARELLSRCDRPTALVAANNVTGAATLRAARALGLHCPDAVSIATVDQLSWSDLISPPLTCAAQPIDEMAALAATWLIQGLESDDNVEPRLCEFEPVLVVGGSTASPTLP